MSEDIGVGGVEEEREESGNCAGELACPSENGKPKQ